MEVLATLTSDVGRILSKLHQVQPDGNINLHTGIRIAHVSIMYYRLCIPSFEYLTHSKVGSQTSSRQES